MNEIVITEQPHLGHLSGIHALRGIAALMVFLFHLHHIGRIPLPESVKMIASHGGLGVMLFFVLSSFSLLYSNRAITQTINSAWLVTYFVKRFFRIAPLFYTMLGIYCFLIIFVFNGHIKLSSLILNISFLFNFFPYEAEGLVWASWSIGVEMVFYALLPLIIILTRQSRLVLPLWLIAVLISVIFRINLESSPGIPPGYPHYAFFSELGVFWGGILAYHLLCKFRSSAAETQVKLLLFSVVGGSVLSLFLLSPGATVLGRNGRVDVPLWGLFFGLLAFLVTVRPKTWMARPILHHFGERSYSIYLLHAGFIYACGPTLRYINSFLIPLIGNYGFFVCAALVMLPILIASDVTYRLIETKGIDLGARILKWYARPGAQ
ncbi:MAG: acyltransferase [Burkholderiaceae bacterium]|nr:acyltransferase [Burkholderiaceae bacterium]